MRLCFDLKLAALWSGVFPLLIKIIMFWCYLCLEFTAVNKKLYYCNFKVFFKEGRVSVQYFRKLPNRFRNSVSSVRSTTGRRQVEQGFSSFFAIFDDFSKWNTPAKWCDCTFFRIRLHSCGSLRDTLLSIAISTGKAGRFYWFLPHECHFRNDKSFRIWLFCIL